VSNNLNAQTDNTAQKILPSIETSKN